VYAFIVSLSSRNYFFDFDKMIPHMNLLAVNEMFRMTSCFASCERREGMNAHIFLVDATRTVTKAEENK
jgi:hypothetical protein